jgi:thiamine pyrophosphokinase
VAGGAATRELAGRPGDLVSLIPLGVTATGVRTEGLRYPLAGEPLTLGRTRGVSNVRTRPVARITLESGRLLVIETPATVRP